MGAGKHHQWSFLKDMCDPRQCRNTCDICFKRQLRLDALGGEVVDMPGLNMKGEGIFARWLLGLSIERRGRETDARLPLLQPPDGLPLPIMH